MEDKLLPEFDENEAFIRNTPELFEQVMNLSMIKALKNILIAKGIMTEDEFCVELIKEYEKMVDFMSVPEEAEKMLSELKSGVK